MFQTVETERTRAGVAFISTARFICPRVLSVKGCAFPESGVRELTKTVTAPSVEPQKGGARLERAAPRPAPKIVGRRPPHFLLVFISPSSFSI